MKLTCLIWFGLEGFLVGESGPADHCGSVSGAGVGRGSREVGLPCKNKS
jgi:hypothetical protein